jgi:hypothetical protein
MPKKEPDAFERASTLAAGQFSVAPGVLLVASRSTGQTKLGVAATYWTTWWMETSA